MVLVTRSSQIPSPVPAKHHSEAPDTIIIAAQEESFYRVFLGENCWYPIRVGDEKLRTLKWIAVYQTSPISAITYFARITRIEKYLETGRYKILFDEPEEFASPIERGEMTVRAMQGQRYTTIAKLRRAKRISDLRPWD